MTPTRSRAVIDIIGLEGVLETQSNSGTAFQHAFFILMTNLRLMVEQGFYGLTDRSIVHLNACGCPGPDLDNVESLETNLYELQHFARFCSEAFPKTPSICRGRDCDDSEHRSAVLLACRHHPPGSPRGRTKGSPRGCRRQRV